MKDGPTSLVLQQSWFFFLVCLFFKQTAKKNIMFKRQSFIIRFCKRVFKPNNMLCLKTGQPWFSSLYRVAKLCNKTTLDAHVRILLKSGKIKERIHFF